MSKQLTLSASIAVLSMALFAAATSLGNGGVAAGESSGAPMVGMTIGR